LDELDGITVCALPLEDVNDPEYTGRWNRNWATPDFYAWGRGNWPHLWVAVLTAIGNAPQGVLIHCAAGRDRTGMVTALLLEAAGVTREAVLDDYERGIRQSSHRDIDAYVGEYRDALDRLLDALVPEPELIRAAERLREPFPIGSSPD
jgi:protein-tyrosine phosphatase